MTTAAPAISLGIDELLSQHVALLGHRRLGVLMNQASVTGDLQLTCDALARALPGQVTALFSPQHGLWGEQQANMIESPDTIYSPLKVPVYSLYAHTRQPTDAMLDGIDVLLIDLQDVGTRVYTFVWTMLECLRACARRGITAVVLDRPNPLGGEIVEGPTLNADLLSFVGGHPIPLRHGLTLAECALLLIGELHIDVELHVIPMQGWKRSMLFEQTKLPWIWPSPNMPSPTTTLVYPGQVLLEGCNLSEGRGTTRPFEVVGAPFLDPFEWLRELRSIEQPGLQLRPLRFAPTFDKWVGESCGGLELRVTEPCELRSVGATLGILLAAARLAPEHFRWLPPPYEYETVKPPIDILFGTSRLREYLEQELTQPLERDAISELTSFDAADWQARTADYLLY